MDWSILTHPSVSYTPSYASQQLWPGLEVAGLASYALQTTMPLQAQSLEFYLDGCWINGIRNCTALCSHPRLIWGDSPNVTFNVTANVNNCLQYMVLAAIMTLPNTTIETEYFETFGIEKDPNRIRSSNINASIAGCVTSFCQSTNKCPETEMYYSDRWYNLSIHGLSDPLVLPNVGAICSSVTKSINPDIAGIGIITAYLIVTVLLILIHIALRMSWNLVELVVAYDFKIVRKLPSHMAWEKARKLQHSIASSTHISVLITALADLQKAQCVFWLAFNFALVACLAGSPQTLASPTLASLYANIDAVGIVCHCALNLVAFGLYCLHRSNKRSWYIYSLSFLSITFSATVWGFAYRINGNVLLPDANNGQFEGCGVFSPITYCRDNNAVAGFFDDIYDYWSGPDEVYVTVLLFTYVILFGLFLDLVSLNSSLGEWKLFGWWVDGWNDKPWMLRLRKLVRLYVECWFLVWTCTVMKQIVSLYVGSGPNDPAKQWSFGQVIALTIWIPVILEWLYATSRGLENASDHRIATPYKVVRTDTTVGEHQSAQSQTLTK